MFLFKTFRCSNCQTVMANLPEEELKKLHGLSFKCECCNHLNLLNEHAFSKVQDKKSAKHFDLIYDLE